MEIKHINGYDCIDDNLSVVLKKYDFKINYIKIKNILEIFFTIFGTLNIVKRMV